MGIWSSILRVGFRLTAIGAIDLPPFVFRVSDRLGRTHDLPASNSDAAFAIKTIANSRDDSADNPTDGPAPFGYVDEVSIIPTAARADRSAWLATIVHDYPVELFDVIDSPNGRFLAERLCEVLRTFPANARWADRFTASQSGLDGSYFSDLIPLKVTRLDSLDLPSNLGETMPLPRRTGKVVTWSPGRKPLRRPSPRWTTLAGAVVQDGGTVTVGDSLIVFEGSSDPSHGFVSGQWQTVFGTSASRDVALLNLRGAAKQVIQEGILLSGRNDDNWFHWLIEYLPRVMLIPETMPEHVPVVISSRTAATGIQALRELTDREIIVIEADIAQRFETLHVLAPQVQVLDSTKIPWNKGLRLNSAALHRVREVWLAGQPEFSPRRRVFLERKSRHRGIENEAALASIAHRNGFEVVDPSMLSFREQVDLFSSTELLVGASGAVMANYIMMRPGSEVIALTSDQLYDFVLPAALAQVAGVRFSYVTGPSLVRLQAVTDRNDWIHSNFRINKDDFENALLRAIAQASQRSR